MSMRLYPRLELREEMPQDLGDVRAAIALVVACVLLDLPYHTGDVLQMALGIYAARNREARELELASDDLSRCVHRLEGERKRRSPDTALEIYIATHRDIRELVRRKVRIEPFEVNEDSRSPKRLTASNASFLKELAQIGDLPRAVAKIRFINPFV